MQFEFWLSNLDATCIQVNHFMSLGKLEMPNFPNMSIDGFKLGHFVSLLRNSSPAAKEAINNQVGLKNLVLAVCEELAKHHDIEDFKTFNSTTKWEHVYEAINRVTCEYEAMDCVDLQEIIMSLDKPAPGMTLWG
jgi:hypothetical protein